MSEISAVVFDLGNVLIPWDRRFLFTKIIEDSDELDYFLDRVLTLEANAQLDRGVPLAEMTAAVAEEHPDHAYLIDQFRLRWPETVGPAIGGSVQILDRLRDTPLRLLALSNWGADTFEMVQANYPFLDWFEAMVISGREGVVKPEPAIFNLLCERHDVAPEQALFIDDSTANIAAAKQLGFETHLFATAAALEEDLAERGLLPTA